jgi:hypothetical protein
MSRSGRARFLSVWNGVLIANGFLIIVSSGCTITWGGPTEHRPAIEAELEADRPRTISSWRPADDPIDRGAVENVMDGRRRDDAPSFQGPSSTIGATAAGDPADGIDPREAPAALEKLGKALVGRDERGSGRAREGTNRGEWGGGPPPGREPGPSAADVDRALGFWEEWKAEHGFAPVDLSKVPPAPDADRKGP